MRRHLSLAALGLGCALGLWLWWSTRPPLGEPRPDETPDASVSPVPRVADAATEAPKPAMGRVLDRRRRPVAGVEVRLYANAAAWLDERGHCELSLFRCPKRESVDEVSKLRRLGQLPLARPFAQTRTDATGQFLFEAVPPDTLVFGFEPSSGRGVTLEWDPRRPDLELPDADEVERIDVIDAKGEWAVGARVTVIGPFSGLVREGVTDDEGHFRVALPDSPRWVLAELPGHDAALRCTTSQRLLELTTPRALVVRLTAQGKPVEGTVTVECNEVEERSATVGGEARFERLTASSCTAGAASPGLVVLNQGVELTQPLTELELVLLPEARLLLTVTSADGSPVARAVLRGEPGSFETTAGPGAPADFTSLPAGPFDVTVLASGFTPASKQLTLQPGENHELLTLEPANLVRGRVLVPGGAPAVGARVSLRSGRHDTRELAWGNSDAAGRFGIAVRLPGAFFATAWHRQGGVAEAEVPSSADEVTLQLETRAAVELEVSDPEGPRPDAQLLVKPADGSSRGVSVVLDDLGHGRVAGLEPGSFVVFGSAKGVAKLEQRFTLTSPGPQKVLVRFEPGVEVEGLVVDAKGRPIGGARVELRGPLGFTGSELAGEDGAFRLEHLTRGEVALSVRAADGRALEVRTTAPQRGLRIQLGEPHRITGRVVDEHGAPVTRFTVNTKDVDSPSGRFDVVSSSGTLIITAPDGRSLVLFKQPATDVGDLVLPSPLVVRGVVLDPSRRPAVDVEVLYPQYSNTGTRTDASGRFTVEVLSTEPVQLLATGQAGFALFEARPGADVEVPLQPATQVDGRVIDEQGRGQKALVQCRALELDLRVRAQSDDGGRFVMTLIPGPWSCRVEGTQYAAIARISGTRQDVLLTAQPKLCQLVVRAREGTRAVQLSTRNQPPISLVATDLRPRTLDLPCGAWQLRHDQGDGGVTSRALSLETSPQQLLIP